MTTEWPRPFVCQSDDGLPIPLPRPMLAFIRRFPSLTPGERADNVRVCDRREPVCGGLAQLGERDNGIVEVRGSSPLSST